MLDQSKVCPRSHSSEHHFVCLHALPNSCAVQNVEGEKRFASSPPQVPSVVDQYYGIDRHVALQFSFGYIAKYCVLDLGNWKDVEIFF